MGPTWVLSAPGGPHVGPMNLAIWVGNAVILLLLIHCLTSTSAYPNRRWNKYMDQYLYNIHVSKMINICFNLRWNVWVEVAPEIWSNIDTSKFFSVVRLQLGRRSIAVVQANGKDSPNWIYDFWQGTLSAITAVAAGRVWSKTKTIRNFLLFLCI